MQPSITAVSSRLNTPDLFKVLRIIRSAKIDKELQSIINSIKDTDTNEREIGVRAVFACLMSVPDAEAEIYDLIGGISERDDIASLPLDDFFALLGEIAKANDLKSFFASALRMTGQG